MLLKSVQRGAEEGFEVRLTWPSSIASSDGRINKITSKRIQFKRITDNRRISLSLIKKQISLSPLFKENIPIKKNQIIASVVPITLSIPGDTIDVVSHYQELLSSSSISDRYAAAKAFSHMENFAIDPILAKINDKSEHIYVKLEAAASLARLGREEGFKFIREVLKLDYLDHRLEAVIILGEIKSKTSSILLCEVLADSSQHEELRSGAAWALGEIKIDKSIPYLIKAFNEIALPIKVEAARALGKLCSSCEQSIMDCFGKSTDNERPGIAWALSRHKNWELQDLLNSLDFTDDDMRQWATFIIGSADPSRLIEEIEILKEKDPELYFAVTVLWKITSSWVYYLKEY